ncbi:MAG: ABC transporter ATP-binding protein [Muribaculaceae bacterium]|nr:ABC transporter ATP-binding protein [Muribaculaceae bacterium]MCM1493499.1 ABC transporter ATP-binding protein [Muribaculaceae bacterium]
MGKEKKVVVKVDHVSIKFNLSGEKLDSLKEYMVNIFRKKKPGTEFWGLKDVSFALKRGDRLGILGLNGAGKSTLLKVVAGVYKPTEGTVIKRGKLAPLLELGAGFEKEYTARENIFLYGAELGYTKKFIEEKFDEIVAFAELEEFLDVPIKNFSSGMRSRLGFAMCTAVNPDILILDEVLSVGDARFKKKSEKKIMDMFDSGVTVLFVSHSLAQVRRICNKAMILDHGKMLAFGDIDEVATQYEAILEEHWGESIEARRARRRKKKKQKQALADARLKKLEEKEKLNGNTGDKRTVQERAVEDKASADG